MQWLAACGVILALVSDPWLVVAAEPAPTPAAAATQPGTDEALTQLVSQIRDEEARFTNYAATIAMSRDFPPPARKVPAGAFNSGPSVVRGSTTSQRQIVQGDRFRLEGHEAWMLSTGETVRFPRLVVCDGSQTVSIEEGNCVLVQTGRQEPPYLRPPHTWGLFHLEVNFPLSVYLSGTEALKAHPKVGRFPVERGSVHEFYKVETELLGQEPVDGLDCVKLRVKRWYYTNSPPALQDLWLAKDRNLHVARTRTSFLRGTEEMPHRESRVRQWKEIAAGVWLPTAVEVVALAPSEAEDAADKPLRRLTVDEAALKPTLPAETFTLPGIPPGIPRFVMDAEGRLIGSPRHPTPAAADEATSLEAILNRLATEESKYDQLEIVAHEDYQTLNSGVFFSSGTHRESRTRSRSVIAGSRFYHSEEKTVWLADDSRTSSLQQQAFDGQVTRTTWHHEEKEKQRSQTSAGLRLNRPEKQGPLRAHTLAFRSDRQRQSLADFLKSGWYDRHNEYPMKVEYVGDERVGDLHCHKLKCILPLQESPEQNSYFFLWLARDRNLLPIRREHHKPTRSRTLPTSLSVPDDLREIRPGVWFPFRTTTYLLQGFSRAGLAFNRPLLQWRRDLVVECVSVEPAVDDSLFDTLEVPEGTPIGVRDEQGDYLGRFKQPQSGNIDISPEQLQQLRQEARVSKQEAERRRQALEALIGRPAPALPRTGWINSEPLSWKALAGKVVVVDFWATWCGPCQADLETLAAVHETWRQNKVTNRVIIGLHTAGTERAVVEKAAAEKTLHYPILIDSLPKDGQASWGQLFEQFAVEQLPMAMVIDRAGQIVAQGSLDEMLATAAKLASSDEKSGEGAAVAEKP